MTRSQTKTRHPERSLRREGSLFSTTANRQLRSSSGAHLRFLKVGLGFLFPSRTRFFLLCVSVANSPQPPTQPLFSFLLF